MRSSPTLSGGLLAAPFAAGAQQAGKAPKIGLLRLGSPPDPLVEAFRQGLRDLGFVEGQNILIEYRWAEGKPERLPDLVAELVRLKVDVIVPGGEAATRIAKQATSTIPIVMSGTIDPVGAGLVASLARPGGNITGSATLVPELGAKQIELLKEIIPKVSRVAVLYDGTVRQSVLRETEAGAQSLGLRLQTLKMQGSSDLPGAFEAAREGRAEALSVLSTALTYAQRTRIVGLAAKNRLPAIYGLREFAEAGGLISFGTNFRDLFRRAAIYVDKILKGAKPADLPIEQPTAFELVINLKTARALGLTLPPSLLQRADEVIE